MKKERIFYLDFIRAIATISILLTHFNAIYIFGYPNQIDKLVITGSVFGLYIGDFGVSLFFIISGAALMFVYGEKIDLKKFYINRFKALYPMFWLAYAIVFLYFFYVNKGIPKGIPKQNIVLTIIGADGYLNSLGIHIPNFYILGEWFLGAIVLLYLFFPLLRWGVKKHPVITGILVGVLYIIFAVIYNGALTKSCIIFNRIPELIFGMYFIEYFKVVNIKIVVLSVIICVINTVCTVPVNSTIQTTYVGIAAFLTLVFVSRYFSNNIVKAICEKISKYSYAIFLVHHVVIQEVTKTYQIDTISKADSYILFVLCCIVIGFFSKMLFNSHSIILNKLRTCSIK